jgi:hypothetical protein
MGVYLGAIKRNVNEKRERSLELTDDVAVADKVLVFVAVIRVDPAIRQLTARIRIQPRGGIAKDTGAPNVNLRFLGNNSPGQQVFDLPEGGPLSRIEVTIPMEGDINRYPLDRYETNIWILVDMPNASKWTKAPLLPLQPPSVFITPPASATLSLTSVSPAPTALAANSDSGALPPAEIMVQENRPVPIAPSVLASTRWINYTGAVVRSKDSNATRVHLYLRRPSNLVNVLHHRDVSDDGYRGCDRGDGLEGDRVQGREVGCSSSFLIHRPDFGLPALQPGIPPVGVLGDYFFFL